jgi:hypothetical protein
MSGGGSKPGERRGGRQKGVQNKLTRDIKEAILRAFEDVGGSSYLATQATENPQAFMALLAKVLPTQIVGDKSNPLIHEVTFRVVRSDHRDT